MSLLFFSCLTEGLLLAQRRSVTAAPEGHISSPNGETLRAYKSGSLVFGGGSHRDHRENEFKNLFSKVSVRSVAKKPHLIPKSHKSSNTSVP